MPSFGEIATLTAQRKSPLFHCENLLARSYLPENGFQPARVADFSSMHKPAFRPLWEDAHTFTPEQLEEAQARSRDLNQRISRITQVFGGPTRGANKASNAAYRDIFAYP